jgi:hypothetical protein
MWHERFPILCYQSKLQQSIRCIFGELQMPLVDDIVVLIVVAIVIICIDSESIYFFADHRSSNRRACVRRFKLLSESKRSKEICSTYKIFSDVWFKFENSVSCVHIGRKFTKGLPSRRRMNEKSGRLDWVRLI